VQAALSTALATSAQCRQAVPEADLDEAEAGRGAVAIPAVAPGGPPFALGADDLATPVEVFVDLDLSERQLGDEQSILLLVRTAATELGALEDREILFGPRRPEAGRNPRYAGLTRAGIGPGAPGVPATAIRMAGATPTGLEILTAISEARGQLEARNRTGTFGLLLHSELLATLRIPSVVGGSPDLEQVEQVIRSRKVAGTSELEAPGAAVGAVCGLLFRLDPPAVDLVSTEPAGLTVQGRAAGITTLRLQETCVVRFQDATAVQHITY
jgi:hypothetical protein